MPDKVKWRVGAEVPPVNVYEGNRLVCQCQRLGDARQIVEAMNGNSDGKGRSMPPHQLATLERIKGLMEKATPEPWELNGLSIRVEGRGEIARIPTPSTTGVFDCGENIQLITELRNAAPWMIPALAEIASLRERIAELEKDKELLDWAGSRFIAITSQGTVGQAPSGWTVDEYEKDDDGFMASTLRAALHAAKERG